jgi:hypothetical protein
MKTIFITIFEGVEVKNILRTPILENLLLDKDIRIVLFTKSQQKVDYYKDEFNDPRIIFEFVEGEKGGILDGFFSKMKFVLLRTETTNLKRKMVSEYEGKFPGYYFGRILNYIFAWSIVRKIIRYFDFLLVKDYTFNKYFDKYSPDLVFTAHLFEEIEINLLREAKKRKVKTIGYINSWDKVTSRCILRLLPDKAIVFNDIVKKEMMDHNEMKEKDIFVSGLPQYDFFYTRKPISRTDFFNKINIPENKKLIVYAPMGRAFSSADWDIIDLLQKIIISDKINHECELLVRFQPNDFVDEQEISKRPNLKYDKPGIRFGTKRGVDWDMNTNDLNHLQDTLYHMSLLICYASSISIDAAIFDKPIININFEINKIPKLLKSPVQYYRSWHYKNALKTGAIDLVNSEDGLVDSINKYLDNPSLNSKERNTLVKEQTTYSDGLSGKRIADYIINLIK